MAPARGPSSSVWPADSVKDVAESCGIANLSDEVAAALATDVEYRLHELVEESLKFMRHAKRTKLRVDDIDYALKARNVEPLYGFRTNTPLAFRKTTTATGTVYYVEDEEIDLNRILHAQLPPAPRDVSYTAHWLAIEGVQPAIPQNPSPAEIRALQTPHLHANAFGSRAGGFASQAPKVPTANPDDVRPLVKHVLSRELQLYFERLVAAATSESDETMREAALASLRGDTGIGPLVPYLVQWSVEKIAHNLRDLVLLDQTLSVIHALIDNPNLFIEPYLHQIFPAVLTPLLTTVLGDGSAVAFGAAQLHSTDLRQHAGSLLRLIMDRYAHAYPALKPRILRALVRALTELPMLPSTAEGELSERVSVAASIGTRYGAVLGIQAMGTQVVQSILGNSQHLRTVSQALGDASQDATAAVQSDIEHCATALQGALKAGFESSSEETQASSKNMLDYFGAFLGKFLEERDGQMAAQLYNAIRSHNDSLAQLNQITQAAKPNGNAADEEEDAMETS
ncbi:uncharacterized protein L969DRAFT_106010 [Mixia osmundae IAM 14324]|uniref:TBP-associated factor 6 n=1 Tax=Mixia osmundae (strain CBS 9802 / IAM 14324 / JCM 22182 / KY 12970) TaxID=764103 RepID=G7E542_MIXOS|nr:uncharacterized protein L969DRAFT_106010 [Mixia osmundae IAM 14324]KEI36359.1 hypothetical protein L969DRAFT_106010 [Mixia osmundae IAM 14324]GAA97952.1 hypothetical protein E5Q_04632 [Mixia osmundae IAM 14324]